MKWNKYWCNKLLAALLASFAVYSLLGFLLVPHLIQSLAAEKLTELLGRETSLEEVRFNPYSFSFRLSGFRVMEPGKAEVFASFGELRVNLQARSLLKGGITVKELALDKPYLRAVHNMDMSYNFSDLIPEGAPDEKEASSGEPLKFSLNNIRVTGGSVDFIDLPKGKSHAVREMNVEIPFISSIPSEVEIFVKPSFSAKVNGTPFDLKGESKPFADSFETSLAISIEALSLPEYLAYSPVPLKLRMPSGTLFADLGLSYIQYRDRSPELALKGALKLRDLDLRDEHGGEVAKAPELDIDIASVDIFAGKARLSSVTLSRPDIALVRRADGAINFLSLFPGSAEREPREGDAGSSLEVDSIEVSRARLSFTDLTGSRPVRLAFDPVDFSLTGFTTLPGRPGTARLDYRAPSGEAVLAEGSLSVNPVEAELELKAEALDVRQLEPYLDGFLDMKITRGAASASGKLLAGLGHSGMRISYKGNGGLSGFSALDGLNVEPFMRFGSLALNGVEFDLAPFRFVARSVMLSDFHARVVTGREGGLNVAAIMKPMHAGNADAPAPAAGPGADGPSYMRIDSVTLRNGRVDFTDLQVEPAFSTSIEGLNGNMRGLFLDGSRMAELALSGKVDKYAHFEAEGKINPNKDDLFIDMRIKLDGYELSSITPYSGRHIGYVVEKGKIFLDLGYRIEKRALKAANEVLIDQITLGQKVDSPQATGLPVAFAISLLKDRKGQITLDLPLSGSLDDPEFSVGALIVQVIFNLVEKAVTSPFALIGGLFAGGEDLGYVEFSAGSRTLTGDSVKKLDALVSALYERPGLKLEIEGHADYEEDARAVAEEKFTRALKAEKLKAAAGGGGRSIDDVEIGNDEFEKYLFLAYKRADFPKEKNFLGMVKKLPAPELERLLREHTLATGDDLRSLAGSRSSAVRDYILGTGKVEPSRVFILWSGDLEAGKKEGVRDSRVEFKLE